MAKAVNQRTTTVASAILVLVCPVVYPSGVTIRHFSPEKMWSTEKRTIGEFAMGVDGRLTGGKVNSEVKMTLDLQPDGEGYDIFQNIIQQQDMLNEIFFMSATLSIPGTGKVYVMTRGGIANAQQVADAGKTLQPTSVEMVWESVSPELL